MSHPLNETIASITNELGELLNVDPTAIPAYKSELPGELFPKLTDQQLVDAEAGDKTVLALTIDHTILKTEALPAQVTNLCEEAKTNRFFAVCVNGSYVPLAKETIGDAQVQVAAVIGFPLGQMATQAKAFEAKQCAADGASEIDMVINVGLLKAKQYKAVYNDISAVVTAAGVAVKVIIETALLTDEEKIAACVLSRFAGAAFVKTSTGFSSAGATVEDIALMRSVVGDNLGVKASGGVRNFDETLAMLKAGANRIGTSSGIAILG